MRVRMKTRYANGTLAIEPDQVGDLPTAEAKDLIAKGFALPVDEDPSHTEPGSVKNQSAAARKAADAARKAQESAATKAAEDAARIAEEAAKKKAAGE